MTMPRRTFLRNAFTSTLSAGLLFAAARANYSQTGAGGTVPIEAQKEPVFLFVAATFEPYVGSIFQAPAAKGGMAELVLTAVKIHEPKNEVTKLARNTKSFALMFKASAELPSFVSIHTLSHPALGTFDLFLTRRKSDNGALFYEAVINHVE